MNREIAMRWADDLDTPGLKQAKGVLFNGEGHCCLGRLCVVLGREFDHDDRGFECEGEVAFLPKSVIDESGMKSNDGEMPDEVLGEGYDSLAVANDEDITFPEIGAFIRENWEVL